MTTSVNEASPRADAPAIEADRKRSALVWDLPTRLFHWSLAVCFAGAWLTSDSERQHLLHLLFGYSLFGLILFRIAWGVVGSRYARFSQFARGPIATWAYVRSMLRGRPAPHVGHNPAGAIAIWLLLGLGLATAGVGVTMVAGGGEAFEDIHEALATAMLVVVGLHLLGVIVGSVLHHENLPRAMVTGRKRGLSPDDGIGSAATAIGLVLLLALGAFWGLGLSSGRPPLGLPGGASEESATDTGEHGGNGMRGGNDEDGDEDD
ncbi:MAG: cytochrome b/b6 domain-containing protein [Pseudomonadota bacterium]